MEKKKVIIIGADKAVISGITERLNSDYFCLSSTKAELDIKNHISVIAPDLVVCFAGDEDNEELYGILHQLKLMKTIFFISESARKKAEDISGDFIYCNYSFDVNEVEKQIRSVFERNTDQGDEKKRVLVVDDDPMMLKLVKEYLRDDYTVATAINGKTAYKFLESKKADLILLDYEMPGENGAVVLGKFRANETTAHIPVLFLTGITEKEKIQDALAQKPQGYISKPIDRAKLIGAVSKFI